MSGCCVFHPHWRPTSSEAGVKILPPKCLKAVPRPCISSPAIIAEYYDVWLVHLGLDRKATLGSVILISPCWTSIWSTTSSWATAPLFWNSLLFTAALTWPVVSNVTCVVTRGSRTHSYFQWLWSPISYFLKTKQNFKSQTHKHLLKTQLLKVSLSFWVGLEFYLSSAKLRWLLGYRLDASKQVSFSKSYANHKFTKLNSLAPIYPVLCKFFHISIVFNKMNISSHHQPPRHTKILSGIFKASLKAKRKRQKLQDGKTARVPMGKNWMGNLAVRGSWGRRLLWTTQRKVL